ncbi:hypothetical protein SynBIOSU31_02134 [Synechococcus sp. BIOS-U3-1]|nr:hypothetical protein SynBIOSU31_02134 [Synechococcus sp. BIOS-U3-1]
MRSHQDCDSKGSLQLSNLNFQADHLPLWAIATRFNKQGPISHDLREKRA